jgi:hypothetical protein
MLVATKRYSPRLVNFAAHSGTRLQTRQNTLFCAPSTNRTEGIVPVQAGIRAVAVGITARAGYVR